MHPVLGPKEGEHCRQGPTLAPWPSGLLAVLATWPQGSLWCLQPAGVPFPGFESGQHFEIPNWSTKTY